MSLEALIVDIARRVARDEIRSALALAGAVYSTTPGAWPPGCPSRRAARERIRGVPGHEREGEGRSTIWRVSVEAYGAHYEQPTTKASPPMLNEEAIALAALDAAGLRKTRKAA